MQANRLVDLDLAHSINLGGIFKKLLRGETIPPNNYRPTAPMEICNRGRVELLIRCAEELKKAKMPLTPETLNEAFRLNWRDELSLYTPVPLYEIEQFILPQVRAEEPSDDLGVEVKDGKVIVSSRNVAKVFEKRHDNVLRDIKTLDCSDEFRLLNFEETLEKTAMPKGAECKQPAFNMTRDGFTFLVMGYNGPKAAAFKEKYIRRFNEMEAALRGQPRPTQPPALPSPAPIMELEEKTYNIHEAAKLAGLQPRMAHQILVQQGHVFKPRAWLPYRPSGRGLEEGLLKLHPYGIKRGEVYGYRVTEKGVDYLAKTVPY